MMKNLRYILLVCIIAFTGCKKDLTKQPDFISEEAIFESKELTEAYISRLYATMPFTSSDYKMATISAAGGENICFADWQTPNSTYQRTYTAENGAGPLDYWPYERIRDMNFLIENISSSQLFEHDYVAKKIAEVRFLRAFAYFELVKRYGGVPLVTTVPSQDDPNLLVSLKRSSEKDIYDFIYTELNEVIKVFPDTKTGALGRADKWAALALQSRAMLYAASIAKFGQVQLDGLLGIPANLANDYYKKSLDASDIILKSQKFSLFKKYTDKVENFTKLFVEDGNDEVIFAEVFVPITKGHSLDNYSFPQGYAATWNSNFPVIYNFVELFEFQDGSPAINRSDLNATKLWDINDFFGKRDPRFKASVFYPEIEFQGKKTYFHVNTTYTNSSNKRVTASSGTIDDNGEPWPASAFPRNVRNTSLLLKKRVDEGNTVPISGNSGTDFYVFRLAEIYLNYAEAAFYFSGPGSALDALNEVRLRAGMPKKAVATEANIRNERQVELAFESHRYWDLIRWRKAVETFHGERYLGLVFKYDLDAHKYIITTKNAVSSAREFDKKLYYLPISTSRINENLVNMVQNPGY